MTSCYWSFQLYVCTYVYTSIYSQNVSPFCLQFALFYVVVIVNTSNIFFFNQIYICPSKTGLLRHAVVRSSVHTTHDKSAMHWLNYIIFLHSSGIDESRVQFYFRIFSFGLALFRWTFFYNLRIDVFHFFNKRWINFNTAI